VRLKKGFLKYRIGSAAAFLLTAAILGVSCKAPQASDGPQSEKSVRALVLTGGHGFEEVPFYAMFAALKGVRCDFAVLNEQSDYFAAIRPADYDVIVMYHMRQQIIDAAKTNLLALCDKGIGIVVLHHSICAYDDWDDYTKLVGAAYLHKTRTIDGVTVQPGTYQHDVSIPVHIIRNHPVTAGLNDFILFDESYKGVWFEPDNTILLTTDQPASDRTIGWIRTYKNSRVCTLQSGHGKDTFENPTFRKLLQQAIRWTANP
jgi:hypothetical protein